MGLYRPEGEVVISGFDRARTFVEGLAPVKVGDKWGYIDKSGKLVIEPRFAEADDFSEGLALVTEAGTRGYIDHSGKLVFPLQFDEAEDFYYDTVAKVVVVGDDNYDNERAVKRAKVGYIDLTGKYIWKPRN